MSGYVKGKRRKLVEAVQEAAGEVLAAKTVAEAYFAFGKLGTATNALDEHIRAKFEKASA